MVCRLLRHWANLFRRVQPLQRCPKSQEPDISNSTFHSLATFPSHSNLACLSKCLPPVSKFLDPNQVELESDVWRQSNKNLIPTLFHRQWMSLFLPYQPKNCDFYSISYRCAFSPFSTVVVVVVYAALKFVNTWQSTSNFSSWEQLPQHFQTFFCQIFFQQRRSWSQWTPSSRTPSCGSNSGRCTDGGRQYFNPLDSFQKRGNSRIWRSWWDTLLVFTL